VNSCKGKHRINLFHFSIHKGHSVDLVLADKKSAIYGIEIKASGSISVGDFKGLQKLAEVSGKKVSERDHSLVRRAYRSFWG